MQDRPPTPSVNLQLVLSSSDAEAANTGDAGTRRMAEQDFERNVRRFYFQFITGCSTLPQCLHRLCRSNPKATVQAWSKDQAALMAVQLAARPIKPNFLCSHCPQDPEITLPAGVFASTTAATGKATEDGEPPATRPQPFLYSLLSSQAFQRLLQPASTPNADLPAAAADGIVQKLGKSISQLFFFSSPSPSAKNTPSGSPAMSRSSSRAALRESINGSQAMPEDTSWENISLAQLRTFVDPLLSSPAAWQETTLLQMLLVNIKTIFSSPTALSSSFHPEASESDIMHLLGVDMAQVRESFRLLLVDLQKHQSMEETLAAAFELLLARLEVAAPSWKFSPINPTSLVKPKPDGIPLFSQQSVDSITRKLRPLIVLLACPLMCQPGRTYQQLLRRACNVLANLRREVKTFLAQKLAVYYQHQRDDFETLAGAVKSFFCDRYSPIAKPDEATVASVRVLSMLYNINEYSIRHSSDRKANLDPTDSRSELRSITHFSTFYCTLDDGTSPSILERFNFKDEYLRWRRLNTNADPLVHEFSLLNYPFLFDPIAKARIMRVESMTSMTGGFEDAFVKNAFVVQAQKLLTGLEAVNRASLSRSGSSADMNSTRHSAIATNHSLPATVTPPPVRQVSPPRESNFDPNSLDVAFATSTNPYLTLQVRREYLIEDSAEQIALKASHLHKPLKIKFVGSGEEGLDQGGVQKEYFQVILEKMMDPGFGVFSYDKETRYSWIDGFSTEPLKHYELFGVLMGLALYNGVMVDANFPDVFYKKLLFEDTNGEHVSSGALLRPTDGIVDLDDISQLYPQLRNGLRMLLEWDEVRDGGSVEDIFSRNFEISYDVRGTVKTYPLCANGESLPVTKENRQEYCRLYVNHLLNESVRKPFGAIRRGFWNVVGGTTYSARKLMTNIRPHIAVQLLRPEELRLMLTGLSTNEHQGLYSAEAFQQLKSVCGYEEFQPDDPAILWFWDIVLSDFTDVQRRKLLWFVTASDRVPLGGLKEVVFVIQKNGADDSRIPTAYTCFGRLLLPNYSSRSILKQKLARSIEESKGFGLM